MSQGLLKLIQSGATAEVADAVRADPALARWRDPQGVSALLWTIYTGQALVRDFLLAQLAAQQIPLDLFEAAALGDEARLGSILDGNPEAAQAFSGDGWTALHLAAAFGTPQAVGLLIERGARVNAVSRNPQHNHPLHAALALGRNPETVRRLLDHGADANAPQAGGFTPIFSAAASNRRDLAQMLLASGADPHPTSEFGKTPADFARERGHAEMAAWLQSQPGKARQSKTM
jgi:ankyrin repeat protein